MERVNRDNIAAIATPRGRGGIAVIRVSGNNLVDFSSELANRNLIPRQAHLVTFRNAVGEPIDHGLAIYFPGPASFTGEDVLELHGHGNPVVMQMLLERCLELGARLARPGEFSERAFLNGQLDLVQAEALADLINATTKSAAKSALHSLRGNFSHAINEITSRVKYLRCQIEATLDFPDEENIYFSSGKIKELIREISESVDSVFSSARSGNLLRSGLNVVLIGQPNVGKSTLLNCLAEDDLAIVTSTPGTTRDALRNTIQIHGVPIHIIDTAGLRETDDPIEKLGIKRTWQEIQRADIALLLIDAQVGITREDELIQAQLPESIIRINVVNKIDLITTKDKACSFPVENQIVVSAKQGYGIDDLKKELLRLAGWQDSEDVFMARERHLSALRVVRSHLDIASQQHDQAELAAEELRLAHLSLQTITGEYTTEELLGEIFSKFCIGK